MTKQNEEQQFDKEFPSFLQDICPTDGKVVPIHNGYWVFVMDHERHNLPQDIKAFIHQKRKELVEEIIDDIKQEIQTEADLHWECEDGDCNKAVEHNLSVVKQLRDEYLNN